MCVGYFDKECLRCLAAFHEDPETYCMRCGKMIDCDCSTCLLRDTCTKEVKTV